MSENFHGGVLTDTEIEKRCQSETSNMIHPFVSYEEKAKQSGKITWGLASCGYDVRLDSHFKRFKIDTFSPKQYLDPKEPNPHDLHEFHTWEPFTIFPGEFLLGTTLEIFKIPDNMMGLCISRSTYARHGIICHTTPLNPGFHGQVTLEIVNTGSFPVKLYPGEGICQFIFMLTTGKVKADYAKLGGKYMHQRGTTGPRA